MKPVYTLIALLLLPGLILAQCPAGSTSNANGSYKNGDVLCITGTFSGNVVLQSGSKMVIQSGGTFNGQIQARSGSTIDVNTNGTFNPSNANNMAGVINNGGRSILGSGGFNIDAGFSFNNSGSALWLTNVNANAPFSMRNSACGTTTFSNGVNLNNSGTVINNDGLMTFGSDLATATGTRINNRGRLYVKGNFGQQGFVYNESLMVLEGGSNNLNGGDSVVNLAKLAFRNNVNSSSNIRNEGLLHTGGSFNYNSGEIRMNTTTAQFRIDGALSNNTRIQGTGSLYVRGNVNNNNTIAGISATRRLAINKTMGGNTSNTLVNPTMITYDTISYVTIQGSPAMCSLLPVNEVAAQRPTPATTVAPGAAAVYPNPFRNAVTATVDLGTAGTITARLFRLDGSIVTSQTFSGRKGENRVSLSGLEQLVSGVYILQVATQEGNFSQKLVK